MYCLFGTRTSHFEGSNSSSGQISIKYFDDSDKYEGKKIKLKYSQYFADIFRGQGFFLHIYDQCRMHGDHWLLCWRGLFAWGGEESGGHVL